MQTEDVAVEVFLTSELFLASEDVAVEDSMRRAASNTSKSSKSHMLGIWMYMYGVQLRPLDKMLPMLASRYGCSFTRRLSSC